MKKHLKKLLAAVLAIVLVMGTVTIGFVNGNLKAEAEAISLTDSSIYLKQPVNSSQCTLYATTMMIRRAAIILGFNDWSKITADNVGDVGWIDGTGMRHSFTYTINDSNGLL